MCFKYEKRLCSFGDCLSLLPFLRSSLWPPRARARHRGRRKLILGKLWNGFDGASGLRSNAEKKEIPPPPRRPLHKSSGEAIQRISGESTVQHSKSHIGYTYEVRANEYGLFQKYFNFVDVRYDFQFIISLK